MTCLIIFEDDYHCFKIKKDEVLFVKVQVLVLTIPQVESSPQTSLNTLLNVDDTKITATLCVFAIPLQPKG